MRTPTIRPRLRTLLSTYYYRLFGHKRIGVPPDPIEGGDDGDPHVEVAIYHSQALHDRNGDAPPHAVAKYAAEALDRAGFTYTVHHDFEPQDPPTDGPHDGAYDWWTEQRDAIPRVAPHSNMLLLDARGGGLAGVTGRFGVAPGQHITYIPPLLERGYTDEYRNIRAGLHEIGHNLGGKHADNMHTPPRMFWNESAIDDYHETVTGES